jgi:hypothetical protein
MKVRLRVNVWLERKRTNERGETVKEVKKDTAFRNETQRMTKSTIKRVMNEQIETLIAKLDA